MGPYLRRFLLRGLRVLRQLSFSVIVSDYGVTLGVYDGYARRFSHLFVPFEHIDRVATDVLRRPDTRGQTLDFRGATLRVPACLVQDLQREIGRYVSVLA